MDAEQYNYFKREICSLISEHNAYRWNRTLSECTKDNQAIYKLVSRRKGTHAAPLVTVNNIRLVTDSEKAEELAKSFMMAHNNNQAA